jgi:beta-lactamase class A
MNKGFHFFLALLFIVFIVIPGICQYDQLRKQISTVVESYPGELGIAIYDLTTGDTLSFHGDNHYPMQSVFKFPIALAVLNDIEKGKMSLTQKVFIKKDGMRTDTWSPLAKKYPDGNIDVTVEELLLYMVRDSDNNACDILLKLLGGPQRVNQYAHKIGIDSMQIRHNEQEMESAWDAQFDNWSSPRAMALLLKKFHDGVLLSPKNTGLLREMMEATTVGTRRMKGELPGVVIAHRTGTSGVQNGQMAAVNDVGIINLPQHTYIILVVFVTKVPMPMSSAEQMIARVTKVVYDHYVKL